MPSRKMSSISTVCPAVALIRAAVRTGAVVPAPSKVVPGNVFPTPRKGTSGALTALAAARRSVDKAKVGLGERGPVWWTDGSPDLNRHMARNTPYADWFASLGETGE